ncbi:MAG: hypothetical protein ACBR22_23720 [Microcoleus sp.]
MQVEDVNASLRFNLPKITRSTIVPNSSPGRTGSQKPGFFRDTLLQPDSLAKTRFLGF